MTAFAPTFEDTAGEAVGDWMPSRYTPSLTGTEDFETDGPKLLAFAARHWSIAEAVRFFLDAWQVWLIRHVLERYPQDWPVEHLRGQLRFRQVVISMGRQNGKSLLGALFVIYFLVLHKRGPNVIGLASVDRQAKIVYKRVKYGVDQSPALAREIKTSSTRGITRKDGSGAYFTMPAKEDTAQGEPATGVLYDELHLGLSSLWDAMLLAMRAQRNALMIGITTAGDDDSLLLVRLYAEGEAAIEGADERFGFFCWEALSPELTVENVIRANPAIACGRVPLDIAMSDAQKMAADTVVGPDGLTGWQRVIRYTLNLFVEGAAGAWASLQAWKDSGVEDLEHHGQVVYSLERTEDWEYASIIATSRAGRMVHTELVASLTDPTFEQLLESCKALATLGPCSFAMPAETLGKLADRLREDGYDKVWKLSQVEMASAAQTAKSTIARRALLHPSDPLLRHQMARAKGRRTGEGWRLSRTVSGVHIDTVLAMVAGVFVATVAEDESMQLF